MEFQCRLKDFWLMIGNSVPSTGSSLEESLTAAQPIRLSSHFNHSQPSRLQEGRATEWLHVVSGVLLLWAATEWSVASLLSLMAGRERQGNWMHFISTVGWIEWLHRSNRLPLALGFSWWGPGWSSRTFSQQASWDCHRENRSVVWKLSYSLSWGHNLTHCTSLHVTAHHCTSSPSSLLLFELPASPLSRFQFLLSGFEALRVAARRFLIRRVWFHTSIYCGLCAVTLCHSFTQDLIKSTIYWARRPTSGKHWPAGTSQWTVSPPCCTAVTCRSLCSCFFWKSSPTPEHIQGETICAYWLAGICFAV